MILSMFTVPLSLSRRVPNCSLAFYKEVNLIFLIALHSSLRREKKKRAREKSFQTEHETSIEQNEQRESMTEYAVTFVVVFTANRHSPVGKALIVSSLFQ